MFKMLQQRQERFAPKATSASATRMKTALDVGLDIHTSNKNNNNTDNNNEHQRYEEKDDNSDDDGDFFVKKPQVQISAKHPSR